MLKMSGKWKAPFINQNLLCLIVGLVALGFAEIYKSEWYWLPLYFSILMTLSVLITMVYYSIEYCGRKKRRWLKNAKE